MNTGVNELEKVAITTSQSRDHLIDIARDISQEINIKYIPRQNQTLKRIKSQYDLTHLLVVREDKIQVDDEFFFHPGMAVPRIKMLKKGLEDPMIRAMNLGPGDKVLDCTLGLANDAIVASFVVGEKGEVVGLESSPIIYEITKWGLKYYREGSKDCRNAMENIKVVFTNYEIYLNELWDNSFDLVYFDPMFDIPYHKSSGIKGLRKYANYQKLGKHVLSEALRVARKRVVIKDRRDSTRLQELGINHIEGGKYSPIIYGIFSK